MQHVAVNTAGADGGQEARFQDGNAIRSPTDGDDQGIRRRGRYGVNVPEVRGPSCGTGGVLGDGEPVLPCGREIRIPRLRVISVIDGVRSGGGGDA